MTARSVAMVAILALSGSATSQVTEAHVTELLEALRDPDTRDEAIHRLVAVRDPAVRVIQAQIESGEYTAQHFTILDRIGPDATGTIPLLLETATKCRSEHLAELFHALVGLWVFLPDPEQHEVWAQLSDTLFASLGEETSAEVRQDVAVEVVRLGQLRTDPRIGLDTPMEQLIMLLPQRNRLGFAHRDNTAARLLGMMGAEARPALPRLLETMKLPVRTERTSIRGAGFRIRFNPQPKSNAPFAEAILRIDPNAPEAAEAHAYLIEHGDSWQRRESVIALRAFGAAASVATATLARIAADPEENPLIRYEAITSLGTIGAGAKDAVPALEGLASDEDKQVAERAKAALKQIRGL